MSNPIKGIKLMTGAIVLQRGTCFACDQPKFSPWYPTDYWKWSLSAETSIKHKHQKVCIKHTHIQTHTQTSDRLIICHSSDCVILGVVLIVISIEPRTLYTHTKCYTAGLSLWPLKLLKNFWASTRKATLGWGTSEDDGDVGWAGGLTMPTQTSEGGNTGQAMNRGGRTKGTWEEGQGQREQGNRGGRTKFQAQKTTLATSRAHLGPREESPNQPSYSCSDPPLTELPAGESNWWKSKKLLWWMGHPGPEPNHS